MASKKRTPNLDGLSPVFEVEVDYDDPRWQRIYPEQYGYCSRTARTGDFPLRHNSGKHTFTCAWFPAYYFDDDPSNQEVIAEITRRNLTRPDRAVSETVLDKVSHELAQMLFHVSRVPLSVSVCGLTRPPSHGYQFVGCVRENGYGRHLDLYDLHLRWRRSGRFLVVVPE